MKERGVEVDNFLLKVNSQEGNGNERYFLIEGFTASAKFIIEVEEERGGQRLGDKKHELRG